RLIQQVVDYVEKQKGLPLDLALDVGLSKAEQLLSAPGSVDLVAVMSAFHWFDRPRFLQEAHRVLKPPLRPHLSAHVGTSSKTLYRESYETIPYTDKEWHDCERVSKTVPLSGYMGMVESFSSYQALLRKDPEEARRLSSHTTDRLMSAMKVTSPDTGGRCGREVLLLSHLQT
ncbi:hypothetical protein CRUP_008341, partial [Coryphaenoides rupestris]